MPCGRRFGEDPASRVAEIEVPNPDEIHERGETAFGRRAALTTAIYAVVLSVAALGDNNPKKEIEAEAKKLEATRDHRRARHPYFEFGEVLLQIAIVSASVAILSTSRQIFWFSLVLAVLGAGLTVNGFVPIFSLSFLHHH